MKVGLSSSRTGDLIGGGEGWGEEREVMRDRYGERMRRRISETCM